MKLPKYYVAGPMTGYPELNFPHFAEITAQFRARGHEIVNPAEVNPDPCSKWEDCMKADIVEMLKCDGVATLKGWEKSRGACLEVHIAKALGMPVVCAYEALDIAK